MRSVFSTRGVAWLALLVFAAVPVTLADDPPNPTDPPDARILPPIGVASQARISPPIGTPTTDARIHPPIGNPQPDARIKPPGGIVEPEPSLVDDLIDWLLLQARIKPPTG